MRCFISDGHCAQIRAWSFVSLSHLWNWVCLKDGQVYLHLPFPHAQKGKTSNSTKMAKCSHQSNNRWVNQQILCLLWDSRNLQKVFKRTLHFLRLQRIRLISDGADQQIHTQTSNFCFLKCLFLLWKFDYFLSLHHSVLQQSWAEGPDLKFSKKRQKKQRCHHNRRNNPLTQPKHKFWNYYGLVANFWQKWENGRFSQFPQFGKRTFFVHTREKNY